MDKKITDLAELTVPSDGDLLPIIDVSDTTDDAAGTSKKITQENLVGNIKSYISDAYLNFVLDCGGVGDGVTDNSQLIEDAIASLPSSGGTIVFPEPDVAYLFNSTIVIDKPVKMLGLKEPVIAYPNMYAMTGVKFLWGGSSGNFISITNQTGVRLENLILDGQMQATNGIYIDRLYFGGLERVKIMGCTYAGIKMTCQGGTGSNSGTSFNVFRDLWIGTYGDNYSGTGTYGLHLSGDGHGNICHNLFERLEIDYNGDYGFVGLAGDNNTFIDIRCYKRGGAGYAAYFGPFTSTINFINNYFYHVQFEGGMYVDDVYGNTIIGYDTANGEPLPTLGYDTSLGKYGKLTYTTDGYNSSGWVIGGQIELRNIPAPGSNPVDGGVIYIEGGALKYRGSSGTVTIIASA